MIISIVMKVVIVIHRLIFVFEYFHPFIKQLLSAFLIRCRNKGGIIRA
jgi:hypothetical protein